MRKLAVIIFAVLASGVMLGVSFGAGTSRAAPEQLEASASGMERVVERRLDRWKPTKGNDWAPPTAIRSPQANIAGTWRVSRGFDGTSLVISRSGPDNYDVTLYTGGCLGSWTLQRTGHYANGVLVLNRPVEEYLPIIYQKLYAVRIGGAECLVPNVNLHKAAHGVTFDGVSFAFRRMPNRPKS